MTVIKETRCKECSKEIDSFHAIHCGYYPMGTGMVTEEQCLRGSALSGQVGGNHYKDMAIQPIEFCQRNALQAAETLAIRYIVRHRKKSGRRDIEKAIHCLQLLLEIEYPEK